MIQLILTPIFFGVVFEAIGNAVNLFSLNCSLSINPYTDTTDVYRPIR